MQLDWGDAVQMRAATGCLAACQQACWWPHTYLRGRACPSGQGSRRGGAECGEARSAAATAAHPPPLPPGWGVTALPATWLSASVRHQKCTVQQQGKSKPAALAGQVRQPEGFVCADSGRADKPAYVIRDCAGANASATDDTICQS